MIRQASVTFNGVDTDTPFGSKLSAKFIPSFAYVTVKDRLPVILTKVIDHMVRDKEELLKKFGSKAEDDIKTAIGQISKLKNEVQTNKPFTPIEGKSSDITFWNDYLREIEQDDQLAWFTAPWLFSENYLYRRLQQIFEMRQTCLFLQNFDPFLRQKEQSLEEAMSQLSLVESALKAADNSPEAQLKLAIKLSLWSNRCDLSLSNGVVNSQEDGILANVEDLSKFVLADDSDLAFNALSRHTSKIVDIVHDNAAYELFADLCLAEVLLKTGLAQCVRLRVKKFPWYVSDTTQADIAWLLDELQRQGLGPTVERWRGYLNSRSWQIEVDDFWTLPVGYAEMKSRDPGLYEKLAEAGLIIFKGDLNYRKLVGDINWKYSTPFTEALQSFQPSNILSLRTIKADVVCGLNEDVVDRLTSNDPLWMRTGEYAVIQCSPCLKT